MKFKRIDVDTVRCIISEDELNENGLALEDFLQHDGRTEAFLRKIISMAEEEVGYKVQGGNISIQVAVLPQHTLALTFSEKPDFGIANMLESLKSAVESFASSVVEQGLAEGNKSAKKASSDKTDKHQADSKEDSLVLQGKNSYQIRFANLDRVMAYAAGVQLEQPSQSSLYYVEREESYYLLLDKGDLSDKQVCRLLSASLEFSEEIYAHEPTGAFIMEHGRCILKENALEQLQEI